MKRVPETIPDSTTLPGLTVNVTAKRGASAIQAQKERPGYGNARSRRTAVATGKKNQYLYSVLSLFRQVGFGELCNGKFTL